MHPDDVAHERVIDQLRVRFLAAKTPAERRRLLRDLDRAIKSRSPRAVAFLERQRGIDG